MATANRVTAYIDRVKPNVYTDEDKFNWISTLEGLVAKKYLSPSGNVNITINGKDTISVEQGGSLLSTLAANDIYLPSAWNKSRRRQRGWADG